MLTKHSDITLSVAQLRALAFTPMLEDWMESRGLTLDVAIVDVDPDPTNDPDSPVWGDKHPNVKRRGLLALRSQCGTVAITISPAGETCWCGDATAPVMPDYLDTIFFETTEIVAPKFTTGLHYQLSVDGSEVIVSNNLGELGRVVGGRKSTELKEWVASFPPDAAAAFDQTIDNDAALARAVLKPGAKVSISPAR